MADRERQQLDEEALRRLLAAEGASAAGVILCLTWKAGLSVETLCGLRWGDLLLERGELWLGQRRILLDEETVTCLRGRAGQTGGVPAAFVLSADARRPMSPSTVYRLARQALAREEALRGVTLKRLREDYRLRQQAEDAGESDGETEFFLWKAVQAEGASPEGLALWMLWRLGLRLQEIVDLTWDSVDMEGKMLRLPQRCVPMGVTLERLLRQAQQESGGSTADPHVLLTPRSRRPYDAARLSRSVEAVLRRFGVGLRPGELSRLYAQKKTEEKLLHHLERRGSISRQEAAGRLGLSPAAAYRRLAALTEQGRLERIGAKYYPAGTAVSAGEMEEVVCAYLQQEEGACCRQVAERLGIEVRQCRRILRRMVSEGRVIKRDRQYHIGSVK